MAGSHDGLGFWQVFCRDGLVTPGERVYAPADILPVSRLCGGAEGSGSGGVNTGAIAAAVGNLVAVEWLLITP